MLTHLQSRIRAAQWCTGRVTLSDGDIAALAQQAADLVEVGLPIHIAPGANDDPYRWGGHGWTVTIRVTDRDTRRIWIPADATAESARQLLLAHLPDARHTQWEPPG